MHFWGKNSLEKCHVDLMRDTRTSTQFRQLFGGNLPVGALIGLLERIY